jgi:NADP-dependent 3-hydroxy acid dehydrogenase YdfG
MSRHLPRKILVTGASRGIGGAITRRLLQEGYEIIGIGRDFSAWTPMPRGLEAVELDLNALSELPHRLGEIARSHPEIDGLVLNAGYGRFGSLEEFSYQQIREMVDTNLVQHIFVARTFLPRMKKLQHGDLVVIGSEAALSGGKRGAIYAACKFGMRGLAQSLREECCGSGIRVCLVNPGMVATDFFNQLNFAPGTDPRQHLRPEDIAEAVQMVLNAHPGTVFDEINLNPLKQVLQFKST